MEENKLIKYEGKQLEKVTNLIAITDKLLKPVSKEEQDVKDVSSNTIEENEEMNNKILAMQKIKAQVMKARAYHNQKLEEEKEALKNFAEPGKYKGNTSRNQKRGES